jgi:hypothetical protein
MAKVGPSKQGKACSFSRAGAAWQPLQQPTMKLNHLLLGTLVMASFALSGCQSSQQAQDPFDVALGMMSMSMMTETAPSDATMQSFARAITPPQPVINQTIVQEVPKQGGGQ